MPIYNIAFSEKLAEAAQIIVNDGLEDDGGRQTVLYLSRLSAEISLKALLEKAGVPTDEIRGRSHNLVKLLGDLSECQILKDIAPGVPYWVSASEIRGQSIDPRFGNGTIGTLLEGEMIGASKYPNEIRYGEVQKDFPAEILCRMALGIVEWAKLHWESIRI